MRAIERRAATTSKETDDELFRGARERLARDHPETERSDDHIRERPADAHDPQPHGEGVEVRL